ncbi:DUF1127 domain-containing protein [Microbaculum marinum]|uniref:DUF1127 domain-containing protein n=1 Tax=Microbaculum marinum TaxID=1764581 RepID=A0AAW9RTW7_9HYPH
MLNYAIAPATSRTGTRAGVRSRVTGFAAAAVLAAYRWYRHRLTAHKLQELDDRMLKDIGLDRSEIEHAAYTVSRGRPDSYHRFDIYPNGR